MSVVLFINNNGKGLAQPTSHDEVYIGKDHGKRPWLAVLPDLGHE